MYMKRTTVLPFLAGAFFLLTGFSWNLGGDSCKDALELANKLPSVSDEAAKAKDQAKILSLCPDGAAAKFVQGIQAEQAGNSEGAIAAYRRALQQNPDFAVASGNLGVLYLQKGLLDDAAVALTQGLAGQPLPVYHKALGHIMAEKKFYTLALYHFSEASRKLPADAGIVAGQAEVYAAQGQTDRAIDEFRRALMLDPTHEQAAVSLSGICLQQNKQDSALDILRKASTANPRSSRLHLMLADLYEQKGDVKQAEYERLLGGKKSDLVATQLAQPEGLALGDQLAAKAKLDKAAEAYRSVLKQQPDSIEPHEKLGALYFKPVVMVMQLWRTVRQRILVVLTLKFTITWGCYTRSGISWMKQWSPTNVPLRENLILLMHACGLPTFALTVAIHRRRLNSMWNF